MNGFQSEKDPELVNNYIGSISYRELSPKSLDTLGQIVQRPLKEDAETKLVLMLSNQAKVGDKMKSISLLFYFYKQSLNAQVQDLAKNTLVELGVKVD